MALLVVLSPILGLLLTLVGLASVASHSGGHYLTWGLASFLAGWLLLSNGFNDWLYRLLR